MSGSGLLPCKLTSNQQLEQRFADQVGEIERIGRLRRFLPPRSPDLIVASGTEKQKTIAGRLRRSSAICAGFAGFSESSDPEPVILSMTKGGTVILGSGRYAFAIWAKTL
jgi:hypothetical protein